MVEKFILKRWQIIVMLLVGSIIRFIFCAWSKAWIENPDQLAWQTSLDEMIGSGPCSYKQLIHYPHEGGSFLISLLAIVLKPFEGIIPSLSLAALTFDFLVRAIQIFCARKLFGDKPAFFFGLWTIVSIPLLLPLSFVNYGIHYGSSFLPFVFLYGFSRCSSNKGIFVLGLFAGLSLSFFYSNIALLPAFIIMAFYSGNNIPNSVKVVVTFSVGLLLGILPHILLRVIPDNGFNLEQLSSASVREFELSDLLSVRGVKHLLGVWVKPLPASFFLFSGGKIFSLFGRIIAFVFVMYSLFPLTKSLRKQKSELQLSYFLIISFLLIYALSPFYESSIIGAYYQYRHLAYVLPLLVLVCFCVYFQMGEIGKYIVFSWILISIGFSALYIFSTTHTKGGMYREAGWVLARKFGEDPKKLNNFLNYVPPEKRNELNIGFGWGVTAAIMTGKNQNDTLAVQRLEKIYDSLPAQNKYLFKKGIDLAFESGVTPVLDEKLLKIIHNKIDQ